VRCVSSNAFTHRIVLAIPTRRFRELPGDLFDGKILIEPGATHSGGGWTQRQMLDEMAARAGLR